MKLGVKTCGAMSEIDVKRATLGGAEAVGVIARSHKEVREPGSRLVDIQKAARVIHAVPDEMEAVLLPSVVADFNEVVFMAETAKPDRLQISQNGEPSLARELHAFYIGRNGPKIAQVIRVGANTKPEDVDPFLGAVDLIHIDTDGETPGGTGETHDWEVSRGIAERAHAAGMPVILAGGLTVANVGVAIETVRPDGVDVETSIHSHGVYNQKKVLDFVRAANGAGRRGPE